MDRIFARAALLRGMSAAFQEEPLQLSVCQTPRRVASGEILRQTKQGFFSVASRVAAFAGVLVITVVSTAAHAQWSATDLNPFLLEDVSVAFGGSGMQVVGYAITDSNIYQHHAGVWNGGTYSFVDLNPAGATSSEAFGTTGTQQVGNALFGNANHAGLWNGTAASWVDLDPAGAASSSAVGSAGTEQVGSAKFGNANHAGLWNGTAASWLDLNPAGATGSIAYATTGTRQAGSATFGSATHASLWSGTAASWVDLNPTGATSSQANGITGTQQVGQATFGTQLTPVSGAVPPARGST